jgi:iron complex transport system substrate-binding protein
MKKNSILIISILMGVISLVTITAGSSMVHGNDRMVEDSFGRQVEIPAVIKRIACMYAFTGHVVAMLGRADDIVAVSNGLKRDVMLASMYPSIRKALVPKFQGAVNIEELARTKPDIVFVAAETGRNEAEFAKLDACGLTWVGVDFHSIEEQQQAIDLIGRAVGASDKAEAYNRYYRECIARVEEAAEAVAWEKRVRVYHATVEPTRTSPANSLPADWMRVAGAVNVASLEPPRFLDGKNSVGIEQIILWNPEVILVNEPGAADLIRKSPKWSALSAVTNGRVYQMPIGISRWGHPGSLETPLAILWAAKTFYPDRFQDLDMAQEVRYFYKIFFDHTLSDKMVDRIMEGKGMRLTKNRKKKQ